MQFEKMFKRRRPVLTTVAVLVVSGIAFSAFAFQQNKLTVVGSTTVQQGDLSNTTFVFGKAAYEEIYRLSFDISGKLTLYPFEEGDLVTEGLVLARLDTATIAADINQAQSVVGIEQARLSELGADSSENSKSLQQAKIAEGEARLVALNEELESQLRNTYKQIRDVFSARIDIYYGDIDKPNPDVNIPGMILTFTKENILRSTRQSVQPIVRKYVDDSPDVSDYAQTRSDLTTLLSFLDTFRETTQDSTDTTLTAGVSVAITSLVNLQQGLTVKNSSIVSTQQTIKVAREQLESLQETGATEETLTVQESVLDSRQADLNALYSDLSKYTLRAPIAGVVFDAPVSNFATVSAGENVISIVEDKPLEVTANVAESDIAFIGIGNVAEINFDAITGTTYFATITEIENRENQDSNVPTYKTTFSFDENQDLSAIRSGMSANISVLSAKRAAVLYVPSSYVYADGDQPYIYVLEEGTIGSKPVKKDVATGLRTNDGRIELTSGVQVNQEIVKVQ